MEMSDLISRKWLIECVEDGWIKFDTEKDTNRYIHLVRDIAPSAQPEIIRCKDCMYWHEPPADDGFNSCEVDALVRHEMFFCADGERKDG